MIYVKKTFSKRGFIQEIEITGHADDAPRGESLVCACVSALVNGIREFEGFNEDDVTVRPGHFRLHYSGAVGAFHYLDVLDAQLTALSKSKIADKLIGDYFIIERVELND